MTSNTYIDDQGLLVIELGDGDRATLLNAADLLSRHDPIGATESYVAEAQIQAACLSGSTRRALLDFRRFGSDSGGLLIRGMPIGEVPATPTTTDRPMGIGLPAAAVMIVLVASLGERQDQPDRLIDKDAHDLYRLLVATDTPKLAASIDTSCRATSSRAKPRPTRSSICGCCLQTARMRSVR
jgi:hypothetical protein